MFLSIFLVLLIPISLAFAADNTQSGKMGDQIPGEIIIGFKPDATSHQIQAIVSSIGGQIVGEINLPNVKIRRVKISSTTQSAMDATIKSLRTNKVYQNKIKYVEPNIIKRIFGDRTVGDAGILTQSDDPLLSDQWGYYDVGANWLGAPTSPAPIIAIVDTGVDYTHPDLAGKVIKGYDYVNADDDPMDDNGHGTHVAGIAAAKANNAYGITGVSWNSKILAIKVINSQGWGTVFDIVQGIHDAANYPGVKVINLSLGGGHSPTEESAVEYAVGEKGKLLVAAAANGNTNDSTYAYPAALSTTYPGVLAVAAHGEDHCKASFSNYGTWVSISAPGVYILSTVPNFMGGAGFAFYDGTSMATAYVSGAAAAAWSQYPTYTNVQITELTTTNTDTVVRDGTCWPDGSNDGTFQRLDLVHMLYPSFYNSCDDRIIYGFALDAETGEPLAGAELLTTYGFSVTGTAFVPYYGVITEPQGDTVTSKGYGLFSLALNYSSIPPGPENLKIITSIVKIVVYSNGTWYIDFDGDGAWNPAVDQTYNFGSAIAGAIPVTGDWNGDGRTEIGVYSNGKWYLDVNGDGVWNPTGDPSDDQTYNFGSAIAGAIPVTGDWYGDGKTKIGIFYNGTWYIDLNGNGQWDGSPVDGTYRFGFAGAIPVTGDWNGSGITKIGVYSNGTWYLDLNSNGQWDGSPVDGTYRFGFAGAMPVTGNWEGTSYARPTLPVGITQCENYAGNIPVPPNKPYYWLAVTWDYGTFCDPITPSGTCYDSIVFVPGYGYVYFYDPGNLNDFPWAKYLWDSDYSIDNLAGNLRAFSEVIRIRKTVTGEYVYFIDDWSNGATSTSWATSGIKAYIYRYDPVSLTSKLVATFTPPTGSGEYWCICKIKGNTVTGNLLLTDDYNDCFY